MATYLPATLTTIRNDLGVGLALGRPGGAPLYWAEASFPGQGDRRATGASITSPRIALDALIEKVKRAGYDGIVVNGPDGQSVHIS